MSSAGQRRIAQRDRTQKTRDDILLVARDEFAANGLSGARVDAIAERTATSKRMIYYHFGSKEGLYLAVLEDAYAAIRKVENELKLGELEPMEAMRRLIDFTFDYDEAHPDFIRLVTIENIHRAEHMRQSTVLSQLNVSVVSTIESILRRGQESGVFRREVDPTDLHMLISSFCFFRVSNRHTFGTIFGRDLAEPKTRVRHKALLQDSVLALLGTA
ncbi:MULTISPECIES: TetR family transcriptional regulator [unclassified Aureimonas]|uniref:TetR family transcriptional regulator n=1 Tax=unclassified Aureimonas TaxID=2615206 RepID=UPI0006FBAC2C|nr:MULTISPECIES: TetR family transcriptional regulator [unclassified Aureimonas]KQT61235.1 TetR family transcriptional regulator [Aureimonas sp. Leaf460]KQT68684.1 TetR family transcriptional regulator [Aureimonas sp. Leaf427]